MGEVKVTVIMAVYNAEPYLRRCLDSLQAQTLKDFDVILVDDGSTDNSRAIAEEYTQGDSRFRVYHKENGGVSSARQYGIERLAENGGKYSIHVDPDDWVEPQMLEQLYNKAKDMEADMVICDFYYNTQEKQWECKQNPKSDNPQKVLNVLFQRLHGSLCNKLIRSACYKEAKIRFPKDVNYCEDFYVNICLLLRSIQVVAYLPKAYYHYDIFSNSMAETKKASPMHVTRTRTDIVKLCRDVVPDKQKDWHFWLFEAKNAFEIIKDGCMKDDELKTMFNDIPSFLFLHYSFWRPYLLTTLLAVRTPINCQMARNLFFFYQKLINCLRGK